MSTATSFDLYNTKLVAVDKLNIHISLKKPSLNSLPHCRLSKKTCKTTVLLYNYLHFVLKYLIANIKSKEFIKLILL